MKKQNSKRLAAVIRSAFTFAAAASLLAAPAFAGEAGGEVVESSLFTLTVPEDIAELCVIEETEDGIAFYEKLASDTNYGGFVASVHIYDSVLDYADQPSFVRGGQITAADGTVWDVVISYPTDVQFDLDDKESWANYNTIGGAMEEILGTMEVVDGTYTAQEDVDTTGVYAETLEKLREDILAKEDADTLEKDGFSYLYSYLYSEEDPASEVGYAFMDLNWDGYDELLLGSMNDTAVYDLYTQVDGELFHVISGGERDIWHLMGREDAASHTLQNTSSGGAGLTEITYCNLYPGSESLVEQLIFVYDSDNHPENPWVIRYSYGDDDGDEVSEEEWNERQSNFGEETDPSYSELSAWS